MVGSVPGLAWLGRSATDQRVRLACTYLRGLGLEIGALHRPLFLPRRARAFYVDRLPPAALRAHYPELAGSPLHVSLVADGEHLPCVRDGALDFLIANHMIEHAEQPIGTLVTFARKLKPGGVLFLAVPDKRRTFDVDRPETSWQHLVTDHTHGPALSRAAHFREWATLVDKKKGAEAEAHAQTLLAQGYSIHYHCWTLDGFTEVADNIRAYAPLTLAAVRSQADENIFILKKS